MLESHAWKYSRAFGVEKADLLGEAQVIFCKALSTYDASKGMFSTHLGHQLRRLKEFSLKEKCIRYGIPTTVSMDACREKGFDLPQAALALRQHRGLELLQVSIEQEPSSADHSHLKLEWAEYQSYLSIDAYRLALWHQAGELEPKDSAKVKKFSAAYTLKPKSIYQRKTIKYGWSWERTQKAFQDLVHVMKCFRDGTDPLDTMVGA